MNTHNNITFLLPLIASLTLTACGGGDSGPALTLTEPGNGTGASGSINMITDLDTVESGDSITLLWSTSGVENCTASGGWSGDKPVQGSEVIGPIIEDITLAMSCNSSGGVINSSVNIQVNKNTNSAPMLSLNANQLSVQYLGSSVINWNSANVDTCIASGGWSGNKAVNGSLTLDGLTESATYILTCSGDNGDITASVDIDVAAAGSPVITFSASPDIVTSNGSTTLNWETQFADSCTATGAWSGSVATAGSRTIDGIQQNQSYTLTCSGNTGSSSASVAVSVMPTVTLSASETSVPSNGSTTISWSSSNATSCEASGDWSGSKATSGSQTIDAIINDSVFTLSCSGSGGTANYSLDITVAVNNNGTALLSWTPPTQNSDGSALNDLSGYKIYYGTAPGKYSNTIIVDNPGLSSYLVENLSSNTWYFVMTAYNSSNVESPFSEEKNKTIN